MGQWSPKYKYLLNNTICTQQFAYHYLYKLLTTLANKALKYLRNTALLLIALVAILLIALRLPVVQTFIAEKATYYISNMTNSTLSVDRIAINFIDNIEIKGLYAETPAGDTLANIGILEVDISIWALLSQKVNIDEVRLSNAHVALSQNDSGTFNFQYLLDAFTSPDTTVKDTTPSAWTVSVDRVLLNDVKFKLLMPELDLNTSVAALDLSMDKLDLIGQAISVNSLNVSGLSTSLILASSSSPTVADSTASGPMAYPIPDIGWDILVSDVSIDKSAVDLNLGLSSGSSIAGIDLNDLAIKDLLIDLKSYQWKDDRMSVVLDKLSFNETTSGQLIPNLAVTASIDSRKIAVDKLLADIDGSVLNAKAQVTYSQFNDLLVLDKDLQFSIDIDETNLSIQQIRKFVPAIDSVAIIQPDLKGNISLKLRSSGTVGDISPSELLVKLGSNTVADLGFSVKGLPNFNTAKFDLQMKDISTSYNDINSILVLDSLPKGLRKLGIVHVKCGITGNLADLTLNKLNISTQSSTSFSGSGSVKGLPNMDTTRFALNIQKVTTRAADIEAIAGTSLPPLVTNLGTIAYSGKVSGTMYTPLLQGVLTTDIGKLTTDAQAKFDTAYSNASYSGSVQVQGFDLGKLLDNKDLGTLDLSLQADGSGIDPKTMAITMDLNVQQIGFKGYQHKNIVVKGDLDSMLFEGEVHIDDPNLQFDLNGLISLRDSMQQFDLTADLDTINLQALMLTDLPISASTHITSNIKTNGATTVSGKASVMRSIFSNNENTFVLDSLILTATESTEDGAQVNIAAPLVNVMLKSKPDLISLPTALLQYLQSISPLLGTDTTSNDAADHNMELLVTIGDITPLTDIVFPALSKADTAWINASFSSKAKTLSFDMQIPEIVIDSLRSGPISLTANGDANKLNALLTIDSTSYTSQINVPRVQVNASLADRKTTYGLSILQDSMAVALDLKGEGSLQDTAYLFKFAPEMTLNDKIWNIAPNNRIAITGITNKLSITDLTVSRNNRSVAITEMPNKKGSSAMSVTFKNFDLKEISDLVDHQQIEIAGVVNGSVKLNDPSNDLDLTSDITIKDITVKDALFGDLSIVAEKLQEKINVNVDLTGSTNDLEVLGSIDLSNNYIDLDIAVNRFYMNMLDPFLFAYIDSSEGYVSLQSKVSGTPTDLSIVGNVGVHDLVTTITMTGERYSFSDNTVTFDNKLISIPQLQMVDRIGNQLTIEGQINHDYLSDLDLDLSVNTEKFSLLNTTSKSDQPYYGTVILGLDATVKGPPSLPKIVANVATKKGTAVYIEPLSFESSLADEDYIIFYDPKQLTDTTKLEDIPRPDEYEVKISGVDLLINFELTPDAKVQIVIDPVSGDTLTTYGQANLTVVVPPTGDPEITGKYTISKGAYKLSYQNLLKKQFEIKPGGSINFSGDPMDARLDITSIYATQASTYELISSEVTGLSESDIDLAQKRTEVNVMLIVKGIIAAPEISFDIQIPGTGISSMVERKLAQLRQEPSELNKQAFGILMFNSFIAEESSGDTDFGNTGSNVALRSVSNLITQQLSRLTNKAKGLSINFTLDSYQSKYETDDASKNVTEVGLDVKKSFLNDRLEMSVGSNVYMENGSNSSSSEEQNYTQIAGHFVLEYKLTENGKYRVKVFNTTDYDALRQSNVNKTGVGITYKESFRKLIQKNKEKREQKKDQLPATKEGPTPKEDEQE